MKKLIYIVVAIALLIGGYYLYIYWALGNDSEGVRQPIVEGENLEGEADPSRMTLTMTTWRWQRTVYNDGRELKPKKAYAFTLAFTDEGSVSITTDCNGGGSKYTANNKDIAFSEIFSTLMFCAESQETEFFSFLENTSAYHFTSRGELVLELESDGGSVVFR